MIGLTTLDQAAAMAKRQFMADQAPCAHEWLDVTTFTDVSGKLRRYVCKHCGTTFTAKEPRT